MLAPYKSILQKHLVSAFTAETSCIRIYLKLSGYPEVDFDTFYPPYVAAADFDTFYPPYVAAAIIIDEKLFSCLSVNGNSAIPNTPDFTDI